MAGAIARRWLIVDLYEAAFDLSTALAIDPALASRAQALGIS